MNINDQTTDDHDSIIDDLRQLFSTCGGNKHDHVIVGITVCIEQGVTCGPAIVQVLARAGLNPKHVGLLLTRMCGPDPVRHNWRRDEARHYHLHS